MKVAVIFLLVATFAAAAAADDNATCAAGQCDAKDAQALLQSRVTIAVLDSRNDTDMEALGAFKYSPERASDPHSNDTSYEVITEVTEPWSGSQTAKDKSYTKAPNIPMTGSPMGAHYKSPDQDDSKVDSEKATGQVLRFKNSKGYNNVNNLDKFIGDTEVTTAAQHLATSDENNFNDRGDSTLNTQTTYTYTLANGYFCALSGWTHTRNYAKGFLLNQPGNAQALVSGLLPGREYAYAVYQFASSYAGTNGLQVNGIAQADTTSSASDAPTATGIATATSQGEIIFIFLKQAQHVHLSGLAISRQRAFTYTIVHAHAICNDNTEIFGGASIWECVDAVAAAGQCSDLFYYGFPGACRCITLHRSCEVVRLPPTHPTNVYKVTQACTAFTLFSCPKGRCVWDNNACVEVTTVAEQLATLDENNFNDRGDSSLGEQATYTYLLANGYVCSLSGWTHTRNYAKGFLRNKPGMGQALISGLLPGQRYAYAVYQFASTHAGTNGWRVNGIWQGETTSAASDAPTATGTVAATAQGEIIFMFFRSAPHVHLSGLAIAQQQAR